MILKIYCFFSSFFASLCSFTSFFSCFASAFPCFSAFSGTPKISASFLVPCFVTLRFICEILSCIFFPPLFFFFFPPRPAPPNPAPAVNHKLFPQAENSLPHRKAAIIRASCYLELIAAKFNRVAFYALPYVQADKRLCSVVLYLLLECPPCRRV